MTSLTDYLPGRDHVVDVLGPCHDDPCDYPDVTWPVARAVAAGDADRGILICGSGIGASIAANKVAGIRAALVHDEDAAELSRRHNDANVLCLAGDRLTNEQVYISHRSGFFLSAKLERLARYELSCGTGSARGKSTSHAGTWRKGSRGWGRF